MRATKRINTILDLVIGEVELSVSNMTKHGLSERDIEVLCKKEYISNIGGDVYAIQNFHLAYERGVKLFENSQKDSSTLLLSLSHFIFYSKHLIEESAEVNYYLFRIYHLLGNNLKADETFNKLINNGNTGLIYLFMLNIIGELPQKYIGEVTSRKFIFEGNISCDENLKDIYSRIYSMIAYSKFHVACGLCEELEQDNLIGKKYSNSHFLLKKLLIKCSELRKEIINNTTTLIQNKEFTTLYNYYVPFEKRGILTKWDAVILLLLRYLVTGKIEINVKFNLTAIIGDLENANYSKIARVHRNDSFLIGNAIHALIMEIQNMPVRIPGKDTTNYNELDAETLYELIKKSLKKVNLNNIAEMITAFLKKHNALQYKELIFNTLKCEIEERYFVFTDTIQIIDNIKEFGCIVQGRIYVNRH